MIDANYQRLRERLTTLDPSSFHYGQNHWPLNYSGDECGCVAWHAASLLGNVPAEQNNVGDQEIITFLDVSPEESGFLFGATPQPETWYVDNTTCWELGGTEGVTEALRRLDLVALRHGLTPTAVATPAIGDEAAFLAALRSWISTTPRLTTDDVLATIGA